MPMLRAVLFDMGDTLLRYVPPDGRSVTGWVNARFHAALAARYPGLALPPFGEFHALIRRLLTRSRPRPPCEVVLAQIIAAYGWPLDPADPALLDLWHAGLLELPQPQPDLPATLAALQAQGLALGIVSNTIWRQPWRDRELARHDLLSWFPLRLYSADLGVEKPDPRIFQTALTALDDLPPNSVLYVGDNPIADVAGAHASGLWTAWLPGPRPARPGPVLPTLTLAALRDLPDQIRQRFEVPAPNPAE
jgi:HAD superfamily hydrolase (TIGR01493 family)